MSLVSDCLRKCSRTASYFFFYFSLPFFATESIGKEVCDKCTAKANQSYFKVPNKPTMPNLYVLTSKWSLSDLKNDVCLVL